MIGIRIRGFRHGARLTLGKPTSLLYFPHNGLEAREGVMFSTPRYLYVFNNDFRNTSGFPDAEAEVLFHQQYAGKYKYVMCVGIASLPRANELRGTICSPLLLPEDFEEGYTNFCAANKKQLETFSMKSGFNFKSCAFSKYVYCLSNASKNFFLWAHGVYLKGINVVNIQRILLWNDSYQQMAKNLKKGTITAYNSYEAINDLLDEMLTLRRNKRVNDTINMFNTAQKKALRDVPYSDEVYNIMSKFNRLSAIKKNNFIRKMSTIDDPNEIIKQMSFVADIHFKWSKESLMEYVNNNANLSCELFYDNGNIVIFRVNDYDTVKRLAKNTNWCISKNKQYWNNYMSEAHIKHGTKQYVLFDFSKNEDDIYSIVGFTVTKNRGITASHNFVNDNILDKRFNMTEYLKRKFESLAQSDGKSSGNGIHALLTRVGVDINSLIAAPNLPYVWNSDGFIDYLNKCVGTEDYDVLTMEDNRLVVLVESPRLYKFLGEYFVSVFDKGDDSEYIIFADFNLDASNTDKYLFGRVEYDKSTHEASVPTMYNGMCEMVPISFDSLLEEYDLPYDIICRGDDVSERVISSICNFDWKGLETNLKEAKAKGIKTFNCGNERIEDSLAYSATTLMSPKFFDVIYSCGYKLNDFFNLQTSPFLNRLCSAIIGIGSSDVTNDDFKHLVSRENIEKDRRYVALCYIFQKITDNEDPAVIKRFFGSHQLYIKKCKFIRRLGEVVSNAPAMSVSSK